MSYKHNITPSTNNFYIIVYVYINTIHIRVLCIIGNIDKYYLFLLLLEIRIEIIYNNKIILDYYKSELHSLKSKNI